MTFPDVALTTEVWLPVVGWEDLYLVSNWARVKSLPRITRSGQHRDGRILKPCLSGSHGYATVRLSRDGRSVSRTIHSLVAEAFHGPCPEGMTQIRHLDGVKTHNEPSNLKWGTPSEDNFDRVEHGTHQYANRGRCKNGHLLEGDNLIIRRAPDGTFKQRVCVQCREDRKAEWAASRPPCKCGAPQFAKGLCQKHYVQQRTAARKAG